jgi:hypothetical protein
MVLPKNIFHMFCIMECCSNYWIPNNIKGNLSVTMIFVKKLFIYFISISFLRTWFTFEKSNDRSTTCV